MEQAQASGVAKVGAWACRVLTGAIAQVNKRYQQLKKRYGPAYTYAMMLAVFIAFFLPIPGSTPAAVALVALIAEIHRAIVKRGGFSATIATLLNRAAGTYPRELVMSNNCDIFVRWGATPEQLTALGAALWRWCTRAAGDADIYRYLDNQALADLIAGKLPAASLAEQRGVHFRIRGEASQGRQATIDRLRREIPADGVEDIVVEGTSWNPGESENKPGAVRMGIVPPHFTRVHRQEIDDRRGETAPRPSFVFCESIQNLE